MKEKMSYFKTNLPISIDAYHVWSAVAGALTSFLWEVRPFIMIMAFLVMADFVTGIIAARHRKERISSRGIFRTVEKLTVQVISVLGCHGLMIVFQPPVLDLTYISAFVICMAELRSIVENTESVLDIEIWTAIKKKINR